MPRQVKKLKRGQNVTRAVKTKPKPPGAGRSKPRNPKAVKTNPAKGRPSTMRKKRGGRR